MDTRAEECIREQEQLASARGVWEGHWREVAERVRPEQNIFQTQRPDGDKRTEKIFDATAGLALIKFSAALQSMIIPSTQRYHTLSGPMELKDNADVQRYLESVNDILFQIRYAPRANFQSQVGEVCQDLGAFGTAVLFIDDAMPGIRYRSFPLAECFVAENAWGEINRLHRKFEWTALQARDAFGEDKLPEAVKTALKTEPNRKFWFLHCVKPNPDKQHNRKDYKGMEFWSCYIDCATRQILDEGGFRTFPFCVPRFTTAPRETYGRSPAMMVLPEIKMVNEMSKTIIRAGHLNVAPPIMLSDDGVLQGFNMRPNALNRGAIDDQGRPKAMAFEVKGNLPFGEEMLQQRREVINDAFYVTLFRILVEEPQMTATEAMLRAQEKGQLLAPTMGRQQTELLGPMINRELDILSSAGELPPMPDALIQAGGVIEIKYSSPLNRAQRAEEGIAILNTLNAIAPLAQIDPDVMSVIDLSKAARELAEINGVPYKIMRSEDEVQAIKDQNATRQQAQDLLAAAPVAAASAKDMAQAQALAAASPNKAPPNLGLA
jgi:hypothetical protein